MAKLTTAPAVHTLIISEVERLALLAGLRYRSSSSHAEAQYRDASLALIDTLSGVTCG